MAITIIIPFGCNSLQDDTKNNMMPDDFDFSLTYGTYGKQKIDTFNHIVVKDLIEDGTIEASISLAKLEKQEIYEEMMKIDILAATDFSENKECEIEPPSFSTWTVQMNGESKSFSYTSYCEYPEDVRNLIKLEEYIHDIVSSKEEYKALPEAKGYYE